MAVIEVSELPNRSGSITSDWKRSYTRTFQVITNDKLDGPKTVREAVPARIGNAYAAGNDVDAGSYCNTITPTCNSVDGKQWEVVAEYGPFDPNTQPANPIDRPLKVSRGYAQFERVGAKDIDGVAVLNSAGDPYDPPLMIDDSRPVMSFTRAELTFSEDLFDDLKDAINTDVFMGRQPGTVKILDIAVEQARDPDIGWYWNVTYQFMIDKDGWKRPTLDIGLRQLNVGLTAQETIKINGNPISSPAKLDGNGRALAVGADPVFLEFKLYKERAFEPLNLTLAMIPHN